MIEGIVPAGVAVADTVEDLLDEPLFPEEEEVVVRAVDKRRREFTTVRACARAALAELGRVRAPMVPGLRGAPSWPPGVVGSMTHCAGYRGAVVAPDTVLCGIGVDAEPHAPLPSGVLDVVTLPAERDHLGRLPAGVCWDRLLFSAKESVYKAWFPIAGRLLGFEDARLTIDPDRSSFTAELLVDGLHVNGEPLRTLPGRWLVRDGLILTAVSLPVC